MIAAMQKVMVEVCNHAHASMIKLSPEFNIVVVLETPAASLTAGESADMEATLSRALAAITTEPKLLTENLKDQVPLRLIGKGGDA